MDADAYSLSLLHFVRLSSFGGVQWQFEAFAQYSARVFNTAHDVMACSKEVHPLVWPVIANQCRSLRYDNQIRGLRLSKRMFGVKRCYLAHTVRRTDPDAIVLWDRVEQFSNLTSRAVDRCIYWEHGSSWTQRRYSKERNNMLRHVSCALANSYAAKRILQLKWGYTGDIAVCLNAVRPNVRPVNPSSKSLPVNRPVRIGVAAKLVAFKAIQMALHVFKHLLALGLDASLQVAGDGPERARLVALAERLGIAEHVVFHGFVADMGGFYANIECLLHTSVSEPFGGVLVEAMAYGCPVFCPAVDGMAEIVDDNDNGLLLSPVLAITDFSALGGESQALPPLVYRPDSDSIDVPMLIDPETSAFRISAILKDAKAFERMSRSALFTSQTRFAYHRHADDVYKALSRFRRERRVTLHNRNPP